ncbi:MAG TPA: hypothetical protein VGD17_16945 [Chitinophagaceae bacterium]
MGAGQKIRWEFLQKLWKSRWGKVSLSVILLLLLAVIGTNLYLKSLINGRLREMVHESSNGLYTLNYTNININALTGNLTIRNPELIPDSVAFGKLKQMGKAPRFLVSGKTNRLAFKNIRWLKYLKNKTLKIGQVMIARPRFNLIQYRLVKDTSGSSTNLAALISKHVADLQIASFGIADATIEYQIADTISGTRTLDVVEHLYLSFTKVHFETGDGQERKLAARHYNLRLKEYTHLTADSMYRIGVSGFNYQSAEKKASLDSFYINPLYSETDYSKRLDHQATRYSLRLDDIVAEGFDMSSFAEEGIALIKELRIGKGAMDMYMDRSLPLPSADKRNVVLSQKIRNIEMPFTIQSAIFRNIDLTYKEYNAVSKQTANISFSRISGQASNITSVPEKISKDPRLKLNLNALFLNSVVKADFEFDLNSPEGKWRSQVRTEPIDADKLNPILVPVAKIEIRKGILKQLEATVSGNATHAKADVNLLYEDLKVNVLQIENDTLAKKGLKTMFANLFIEDDNPKDGVLRKANGVVRERKHGKSFFNLLWSSISAGMQQIILKKNGLKI